MELGETLEYLLVLLVKGAVALGVMLSIVPNLVWMERKVSARIQRRVGPNRMGPAGLFQTAMDGIKLLFKEQFRPEGADRWIYLAAPIVTFLPGLIAFGLIPASLYFPEDGGPPIPIVVANVDLAIIVIFAISSVASYGIAYAGWSSGNQYAMLGGIRACAQLVSYEIVLGLALVATVMLTGSFNLVDTVLAQSGTTAGGWLPAWNIFAQPLTFALFLIAAFAETNRAPFDLAEAEQELVGGYHTEYSGIRFGWFMFGEYAALWTMCSLIVAIFLGGWTLPGVTLPVGIAGAMIGVGIHNVKVILLIFFFMWVRWTMPRVRWDQLMSLGWNRLIPLGVANIFVTILIIEWFSGGSGESTKSAAAAVSGSELTQ